MRTKTITQVGIQISGIVSLNLWNNEGEVTIKMEKRFLPNKNISKDNILRCVNDNSFGCKSIVSSAINISIVYNNGCKEFIKTIFTDCKHHTKLFNDWKTLRAEGIEI